MTRTALAAAAGMSAQAISQLESESSHEPSYTNGLRLAFALGVSPWKLAGEPEPSLHAGNDPASDDDVTQLIQVQIESVRLLGEIASVLAEHVPAARAQLNSTLVALQDLGRDRHSAKGERTL